MTRTIKLKLIVEGERFPRACGDELGDTEQLRDMEEVSPRMRG